jgi:hypothetical protein
LARAINHLAQQVTSDAGTRPQIGITFPSLSQGKTMKIISGVLVLVAIVAAPLAAQGGAPAEREIPRFSVNLFRAPSTGVDYRFVSHASAHVGLYPTVLSLQGEREQINFIRVGGTYWLRPAASGFYFSTGVAWSLERHLWGHSLANEVGYHQQLGARWGARLGANLLTAVEGMRSRLNPTIGLTFRAGARRVP